MQVENMELDHQRFQDPLTQLLNRRYVMENRATILQKILQQNAAIMIVDADYFKKINDSFCRNFQLPVFTKICDFLNIFKKSNDLLRINITR